MRKNKRFNRPISFLHVETLESRELLTGNSISDSGGFEGSQQSLQLSSTAGSELTYRYQHFFIPDNFIIRYEGQNLFETGFTGGSRTGKVMVPPGNSDTVEVLVATNNSGTAWNYDVSEESICPETKPFVIELAGDDFERMEVNGKAVCKGTGTVFVGRSQGIGRMIRVENATAEFDDSRLKISGTVFSEIGAGDVLSKPLFTGSFELPFQGGTGTASSFSESGGGGNEFELGGMDVDFSGITLNPNNIALGAKFELIEELGLPDFIFNGSDGLIISQNDVRFGASIKFAAPNFSNFNLFGFLPIEEFSNFSIDYVAPEDAVKIQGKLKIDVLPSSPTSGEVEANLAGQNYVQIKGGQADVKGELTIQTDLKFPKGWGLEEVKLKVDTVKKDIGGSAKLTLPFRGKVSAEGEVGFKLPIPPLELNRLGLNVDNLNVPVPPYPTVFFQGFRGAVENFSDADPDAIEFSGGLSATLGPRLSAFGTTFAILGADIDGKLSAEMAEGTGVVTVLNDKVLQLTGSATLDWTKKFFKASGGVNILDGFITTNDAFKVSSNFDVSMGGSAIVSIPNFVPLVGGAQLGPSNYAFAVTNNGNSSDDFGAGWGTLTIGAFGIQTQIVAGAKIYGDGRVERIGTKNIPPTSSFEIQPNTDWVLLGADWENANPNTKLRVRLPDGTWLDESDFAANQIAVVNELSNDNSRVVILVNPTPGIWDVEVDDPAGLGAITYSAAEDSEAPTITVTSPSSSEVVSGGQATITYDAFDADSDAKIRLFYDDDNSGQDGVMIANGLLEQDGSGSFVWDTTGVPTGTYSIYAMIDDDVNAPVVAYAAGTIEVTDSADVEVAVSAPTSVGPNEDLTYTYTVTNGGSSAASNVSAMVSLPANALFVSSTLVPDAQSGSELEFDLGTLTPNQTITFDAIVTSQTDSPLRTSVEAFGNSFDPITSNNSDFQLTAVEQNAIQLPDLSVSLSRQPGDIALGEAFSYELTVTNDGVGPATDVVLTELFPSEASFTDASVSQGTWSFSGGNVNVDFETIAAGSSATVEIFGRANVVGRLVSSTTVSSNEEDALTLDNNLITSVLVAPGTPAQADLSLTLSVDNEEPSVGDEVVITTTLSNAGPGIASGVSVAVELPDAFEFVSWSGVQGSYSSQTGVWNVGNIRDNLSRSLNIRATAVAGSTASIDAEVVAVNEVDPDSTPNNGVATEDDYASIELIRNEFYPEVQILDFGVGEVASIDAVTFTATATDPEDGDISASVSWTSSVDGFLGVGATVASPLSAGTHTISALATDSGGFSTSDSVSIFVPQSQVGASISGLTWLTPPLKLTPGARVESNSADRLTVAYASQPDVPPTLQFSNQSGAIAPEFRLSFWNGKTASFSASEPLSTGSYTAAFSVPGDTTIFDFSIEPGTSNSLLSAAVDNVFAGVTTELPVDPPTEPTPSVLPGDADGDGLVGFSDFAILAANFGRTDAALADGDLDGDGRVAFSDFAVMAGNFGRRLL